MDLSNKVKEMNSVNKRRHGGRNVSFFRPSERKTVVKLSFISQWVFGLSQHSLVNNLKKNIVQNILYRRYFNIGLIFYIPL